MKMHKIQTEASSDKFFTHLADRAMQFYVLKLAIEIAKIPTEAIAADDPKLVELI